MTKLKRIGRRLRTYARAHRKVLIGAATIVLVQYVDSETADWIASVLGLVLLGRVPNDQGAIDSIYHRRRR